MTSVPSSPKGSWKLKCSIIMMLSTLCPFAAHSTLPVPYTCCLDSSAYYICFCTNFAVGFIYLAGALVFLDLYCSIYCRLTHVLNPQTGLKPASSHCWSSCKLVFSFMSSGVLICLKLCMCLRASIAQTQHV